MNKTELITKLAKKTDLTHAKAAEAVDAIFNAKKGLIVDELAKGKKVTLPGFGSFSIRKRASRLGRNPATGAAIKIPLAQVPGLQGRQDPAREGRQVARLHVRGGAGFLWGPALSFQALFPGMRAQSV